MCYEAVKALQQLQHTNIHGLSLIIFFITVLFIVIGDSDILYALFKQSTKIDLIRIHNIYCVIKARSVSAEQIPLSSPALCPCHHARRSDKVWTAPRPSGPPFTPVLMVPSSLPFCEIRSWTGCLQGRGVQGDSCRLQQNYPFYFPFPCCFVCC